MLHLTPRKMKTSECELQQEQGHPPIPLLLFCRKLLDSTQGLLIAHRTHRLCPKVEGPMIFVQK